jgi:hypothetical protein
MKLKIKSAILKEVITKVTKASTNNKMVPLTGLLSLSVKNGIINAVASDAVNYFEVSAECSSTEDFAVVVKSELFSKIVSKTTSEYITLELLNNALNFTGNGVYKIDLPLDEEGQPIKYPVYWTIGDIVESGTISLATIKSIILANKPALALSAEAPYLMNYYCGDNIISADSYNICINKTKIFETPMLLSPMIFDLLSLFSTETIDYSFDGTKIAFKTGSMKLYAKIQKGIEDYPVEAIMGYMDEDLPSNCAVSKSLLLDVIDRLSLFISDFDVNGVYLNFTNEGLKVTSKNNSGSELITYKESNNFTPFVCLVSVEALKKQVNARSGDILYIQYGLNNALKFVDNNILHVVALLEDDATEDDVATEVALEDVEDSIE